MQLLGKGSAGPRVMSGGDYLQAYTPHHVVVGMKSAHNTKTSKVYNGLVVDLKDQQCWSTAHQ